MSASSTNQGFHERLGDRLRETRPSELWRLAKRAFGLSALDPSAYDPAILDGVDIQRMHDIAYSIRGENYRPAIIVHGVMPRSGTNFVSDLFKLHDDVSHHPHRLWEFPLLHTAKSIDIAQRDFLRTYKRNSEVLTRHEFMSVLVSGYMRYLQSLAGEHKTILLKVPHAEYLYLFHALLPRDHLIVVLRDGRDCIASYESTFGHGLLKPGFSELCKKWSYSTMSALAYESHRASSPGQVVLVRYEEANADPVATMHDVIDRLELNADNYAFSEAETIPVRGSSAIRASGGVDWKPREKPADFQPKGRWHGWSDAKKKRFKRDAGSALIEAKFAADLSW